MDEFLELNGPISIDEFLEEEREIRAKSIKDQALSVSAATESVKTGSSATESISPVPDTNLASVVASDPLEAPYESDSVEFHVYEDKENNHKIEFADSTCDESDDAASEEIEVGSNRSSYRSAIVKGQTIAPETEEQEWTYEDYISSDANKKQHRLDREQRSNDRYENAERRRVGKLMYFGVFLLLLEVAGASIAVKNHQELVECCGRSIFSEDESVGERWNKIFFWVGIIYLPVIILIEIPTLIIAQETLFLFNPMVGYLLAMQMLYTTDVRSAWIIFILETVAMLGQSCVLSQMRRRPESCLHSILNYTLGGITIYMMLKLTQQGGFCIVDDRIQSVLTEPTCNVACIDEETCFRCTSSGDETFLPQCFVRFPEA